MFPYSFSSLTWAVMCWSLAERAVPKHVHLVSSARRERSRGRTSLRAEAFLELLAMLRPCVLPCAFPGSTLALPHLSWGSRVHKIPVRKFWVLLLCKMRHYVGCLNVLSFFTVNLRNLNLHPCVVPTPVFMKSLSHLS